MKINPISFFKNPQPQKTPDSAPLNSSAETKKELYSSEDSIAIKNIYGSTIKTSKKELQEEAQAILEKCPKLQEDGAKIKKACEKKLEIEPQIQKYADAMYANAQSLYGEVKKYEDSTRQGSFKIGGNENSTNLVHFTNGKVDKIYYGVKKQGDTFSVEHYFIYSKDDVIYSKNAKIKDDELISSDEEYYYTKGKLQKYSKNTHIEDGVKTVDEIRLYRDGTPSFISLNYKDYGTKRTTDNIFYFDADGLDGFIQNQVENIEGNKKQVVYDFTLGDLTNYIESQVWTSTMNHSDLKIDFKGELPIEAFINSDMGMTSFMTADKQFVFEDGKAKTANLAYVRSQIGSVSVGKTIEL